MRWKILAERGRYEAAHRAFQISRRE